MVHSPLLQDALSRLLTKQGLIPAETTTPTTTMLRPKTNHAEIKNTQCRDKQNYFETTPPVETKNCLGWHQTTTMSALNKNYVETKLTTNKWPHRLLRPTTNHVGTKHKTKSRLQRQLRPHTADTEANTWPCWYQTSQMTTQRLVRPTPHHVETSNTTWNQNDCWDQTQTMLRPNTHRVGSSTQNNVKPHRLSKPSEHNTGGTKEPNETTTPFETKRSMLRYIHSYRHTQNQQGLTIHSTVLYRLYCIIIRSA